MNIVSGSTLLLALLFISVACTDTVAPDQDKGPTTEVSAPAGDTTPLAGPGNFQLNIEGMSCQRCAKSVRGRLATKLPQLEKVAVDHEAKRATFALAAGASISEADCIAALEGMNYQVTGLEKARP